MSIRKFVLLSLAVAFLIPATLQSVFAAAGSNPNWKQEQSEMFKKIGLKPGDVLDTSNHEKLKDVLPEPIVDWVKKGEFRIKVGAFKYDFSPDKQWLEDSKKNAGKYKLQKGKVTYMVDGATDQVPKFVYGRPFPNVDVKGDPDGPMKLMYNQAADNSRAGSQWNYNASLDWIGEGGYERSNVLQWIKYSFWQRPDGEQPNPKNYYFMELLPVTKPYDSKGVVTMYFRMADGTRDQIFTYIPAIRRVKRMSGANRSDPTLGSDTCMDDAGGWSGDNSSMKWQCLGEQIVLMPMTDWATERPRNFSKQAGGGWMSDLGEPDTQMGWMDPDSTGVPWELMNVLWCPREMWVLEATPLDPYYAYGKCTLYVDKITLTVVLKTIYNKAMEYWRTSINPMPGSDWGERRSFNSQGFALSVDDRTHHATQTHSGGSHRGEPECRQGYMEPRVNRAMFVPSKLRTWSK